MIEKNVIKMLPSKQTSFYYFTCLPGREHINHYVTALLNFRFKQTISRFVSYSAQK